MIRDWLKRYWWVNESGKVIIIAFFGYVSWATYQIGELPLAFVSGICFVVSMVIFCDVLTVLVRKIRGKPVSEGK